MTMRLFRFLLSWLSCHPVKKAAAAFSYVIVFVKTWTLAIYLRLLGQPAVRPPPSPLPPSSVAPSFSVRVNLQPISENPRLVFPISTCGLSLPDPHAVDGSRPAPPPGVDPLSKAGRFHRARVHASGKAAVRRG